MRTIVVVVQVLLSLQCLVKWPGISYIKGCNTYASYARVLTANLGMQCCLCIYVLQVAHS